jgi:cellulose synthase/poly-beta-1,6-N-acetylglucosamine synthase-like glycosyltransferase
MQSTINSLSIIITACQEEKTVGRAIDAFLCQDLTADWELLVVSPDDDTLAVAASYSAQDERVRCLRDQGRGKPAALNLALAAATGEIAVLSDGDVYVAPGVVQALLQPFSDPQVGIVSGRPISLNPRHTMLGYWSHALVDAGAHRQRSLRVARGEYLECSGYLYAFRRALFATLPDDALAEDGLVSHRIWEQGFLTAYAPEALVYVKYPSSYQDWVKQKVRTAGGYAQPYLKGSGGVKSFRGEATHGSVSVIQYAQNLQEQWWTLLLLLARVHIWLRVWWVVKVRRKPFADVWQRVHSTK